MIVCPLALADLSDAEEATVSYKEISEADFLKLAVDGVIDLGDENYSITDTDGVVRIETDLTIRGDGNNHLHARHVMDPPSTTATRRP